MPKIFFSLRPPEGSYGGGAFFVKNMSKYLIEKNYQITYELEPGIDLIFMIDPRQGNYKKYGLREMLGYKKQNPKVKILYRVNECDIKRQHSIGLEGLIVTAISQMDYVVFVSAWLEQYYLKKYHDIYQVNHTYILNGCDQNIFKPSEEKKELGNKIKLVTHHFSCDYKKGFHIYNELDKILPETNLELTYIGNYHPDYQPKNIKLEKCDTGESLAQKIRQHDIYLTATQYEPGAMHYLEGISCGLPLLYCINGGGAQEVGLHRGEEYHNIPSLLDKIKKISHNYSEYLNRLNYQEFSSDRCSEDYFKIINRLLEI